MMEFSMGLLYLDFSKMEDGNMLLLILESLLTHKLKLRSMATAQIKMNFGFH